MEIKSTESKTELRKAFKQKRDQFFANQDALELSQKLASNLAKVLPKNSQNLWASYRPIQSEADPTIACESSQLKWCYPVITESNLEFFEPRGSWTKNQFKIQEPNMARSRKVSLSEIEGMLVPGIAFDLQGRRIGWGKGHYDKTLEHFSGIKIGIAYSVQLNSSLPFDSHDIQMDMIVTEEQVINVRRIL